jgi:hypothetical protein
MGAIWTKNGWDFGQQLGAAAFMVETGVPYGEFGVYMKKAGAGAMDAKQAYTNLLWNATEQRAATMGAVRGAIPGDKEFGITSDDIFSKKTAPGKTLVVGAS